MLLVKFHSRHINGLHHNNLSLIFAFGGVLIQATWTRPMDCSRAASEVGAQYNLSSPQQPHHPHHRHQAMALYIATAIGQVVPTLKLFPKVHPHGRADQLRLTCI